MVAKRFLLFTGLAWMMTGCQTAPAGKDDVLLTIGRWQLTAADCNSIISGPSWKALTPDEQYKRLVEEGRILAFAMEHGFDTMRLLRCQLDYAMHYYVSSVDGYVWNRKVKPLLQVPGEAIHKAHALRTHEYQVETIYFSKESLLKKYYTTPGKSLSVPEFYALQQKVKGVPGTNIYSGYLRYPFYPLGVYLPAIGEAVEGTVWGPVETASGFYFVHLAGKRPLAPEPIAQTFESIREALQLTIKEKAIWESKQQVWQDMKPVLNEAAIATWAASKDSNRTAVSQNLVLMEYTWEHTRRKYTVAHFNEYVQCQPAIFGSLNDADDIKQMLNSWLIGIHLYAQAQQLNMEQDSAYRQFRDRYQQQLFIGHFKNQYKEQPLDDLYPVRADYLKAYLKKIE